MVGAARREGGARVAERVATAHLQVERSHQVATALHRRREERGVVPRHHPPAVGRLVDAERQHVLDHNQTLHQPARHRRRQVGRRRRGGARRRRRAGDPRRPGLRAARRAARARPRHRARRLPVRHVARAAGQPRAPVGDHLRLLAVGERELAVGRQRLPVHVALRVDRHELELDLAARRLVAQQQRVDAPRRVLALRRLHPDAAPRLPAAELRQVADDVHVLAEHRVRAHLEVHAHEERARQPLTVRRLARQLELRAERGARAGAGEGVARGRHGGVASSRGLQELRAQRACV